MKAKLLVSQSGLAAGATYEIDGQPGLRNALLKNGEVSVSVPLADLEIEAHAAAPERAPEPFSEPLPDHVFIDEINEDLARGFYDEYCEAVGGKAFNGDLLPPAEEFFTDPAKAKQANAYRAAIAKIVPLSSYSMESDDREPEKDLLGAAAASSVTDEPQENYANQTELDDHLDQQLEESQKPDADLDEPLPEKQCDATEGECCDSCQ